MNKPILCVDFDGVIHSYTSGWKGETVIPDPPVPGALSWLWRATEFFDVQIYSSRSKDPFARIAMYDWMVAHSLAEFGDCHPMSAATDEAYPVSFAHEKPPAFLTIDDRAICFDGDWSGDPADLLTFKPWNKRTSGLVAEQAVAKVDMVGAAEAEVGRYIYRRLESLMGAAPGTPEAAELTYLSTIAESVEEYGEQYCGGAQLMQFPLAQQSPASGWRPTHRHVKRGSFYRLIGGALVQAGEPLADNDYVYLYQDADGLLWVRSQAEFMDGRFALIDQSPA